MRRSSLLYRFQALAWQFTSRSRGLESSEETLLQECMCFSNEPMLEVLGEHWIRLEDHFYMTSAGLPRFTETSMSIDSPFG